MRIRTPVLATCLALSALTAGAADTKQQKKGSGAGKGVETAKAESLTGCVDQRGETYILSGAQMKEEAKLSGKAFADENFARYIGHLVTVRGTVDRSTSPPVVQVVKIDEVSATCR